MGNNITPEELAYFIYNLRIEESEDFFKKTKEILQEKADQEIEEIRSQLDHVNQALDQSIERKKKLKKLSKKM